MKIFVNSEKCSLCSMNKYDICQSRRNVLWLYLMLYQPVLDVLPKHLNKIHSPRRDESHFLFFCSQKVHTCTAVCLLERYLFYIIPCNSSVKKLKLESLKFGFFRAVQRQNIWLFPFYEVFVNFRGQWSIYSGFYQVMKWFLWQFTFMPLCKYLRMIVAFDYKWVGLQSSF